ncbi:MAG: MOSC domain-containing protein [Planctomycetota bacterium]
MALEMKQIRQTMPQVGKIEWIGLRTSTRGPISVVEKATIGPQGLEGDRYNGPDDGDRMVTLILKEHIQTVASILGRESLDPELLRRNIVVSGINLTALKKNLLQIGDAILLGTGNCAPCSLMEENLGPGGYNAMRGHGGLTTRVIQGGVIQVGDEVKLKIDDQS